MKSLLILALACAGGSACPVPKLEVRPPVLDAALRNPLKGFIPHYKEVVLPGYISGPLIA